MVALKLFSVVVATLAVVLGLSFVGLRWLNKAADEGESEA